MHAISSTPNKYIPLTVIQGDIKWLHMPVFENIKHVTNLPNATIHFVFHSPKEFHDKFTNGTFCLLYNHTILTWLKMRKLHCFYTYSTEFGREMIDGTKAQQFIPTFASNQWTVVMFTNCTYQSNLFFFLYSYCSNTLYTVFQPGQTCEKRYIQSLQIKYKTTSILA